MDGIELFAKENIACEQIAAVLIAAVLKRK